VPLTWFPGQCEFGSSRFSLIEGQSVPVFTFALKLIKFLRDADFSSLFLVVIWIVFFPALWLYARFYPRMSSRVLFWSNEGFRVAPTRVRSYGFCREMVKLGVDADVLTFWDHLAKYEGLIPFRTTLGFRTKLTFRAMMAAVRSRAAIIIFQRPFYEFMSVVSLKLMYPLGLRIWLDVDDWIFDEPLTPPPASITFRNMLAVYAAVAEGSVVASLRLEEEMSTYVTRVEIIPTYPDHTLFRTSTSEEAHADRVVFSWIGTLFMEQVKRDVLFLVDVLESLQDRRVVFEVLGEGRFLDETRREAERIAHHANVVFLGWKEPDAVPAYLQTIDVGLYCLTTHNVFCASKSPTKLFEYMACGKATVSTDFGEAPRFIEHGKTGFIAADKDGFARCCELLLGDASLRREMGENARRKIETEYNLESAGRTLKALLEKAGEG
jgi:glycosyltransferase involved in cell wall biosynthesis